MPVILRIKGYEFFFYSNEGREPIHVHVEKAEGQGKIWLEPEIEIAYMYGFTSRQKREINQIIEQKIEQLKQAWNEYFRR